MSRSSGVFYHCALRQVEHSVSGVLGLSVQHSARVGVTVTTDTATLATFTGVVYQVSSVLLNVCDYQRVYASYKVITTCRQYVVAGLGVSPPPEPLCCAWPRRGDRPGLYLTVENLGQTVLVANFGMRQ